MKTKLILIAFTALLILNSCKVKERTTYVDRWRDVVTIDSIYKYDKDTMIINFKGDTVYVHHYSTKIEYKFKYIAKTDTFTQVLTENKIIEKKIEVPKTRWYGYFDIFLLAIVVIYLIYKLYSKFKI